MHPNQVQNEGQDEYQNKAASKVQNVAQCENIAVNVISLKSKGNKVTHNFSPKMKKNEKSMKIHNCNFCNTVTQNECYTPSLMVFCFVHFNHLPKEKV